MKMLRVIILSFKIFYLSFSAYSSETSIDSKTKALIELAPQMAKARNFPDVVYITHAIGIDQSSIQEILKSDNSAQTKYLKKIISRYHKLLQPPYIDLITQQEQSVINNAQLHLIHNIRKQLRHSQRSSTKFEKYKEYLRRRDNQFDFEISDLIRLMKYFNAHMSVAQYDKKRGFIWAIDNMLSIGREVHQEFLYLNNKSSHVFEQIILYENSKSNSSELLSDYFITMSLLGPESTSRLGHEYLREALVKIENYILKEKPLLINSEEQKKLILKRLFKYIKQFENQTTFIKKNPQQKLRFQNIFLFLSIYPTEEFVNYILSSLKSKRTMKIYSQMSGLDNLLASAILKMTDPRENYLGKSEVSNALKSEMHGLRTNVLQYLNENGDFRYFEKSKQKGMTLSELKGKITSPLKRCQEWFEDNF
ncbi:MAG: hypothetical protein H6622_15010 [Halobacteriovoraceae bacterium]|nr:hypothetical protein [Halobacteriovoraceae bacterium]